MTPPDFASPLPARPLPLDTALLARRFRQLVPVTVVTGAFTLFLAVMSVLTVKETFAKRSLWQRGTPAVLVDFSGQVTKRSYFGIPFGHDYRLDVVYTDAAGAEHKGQAKFDYLFSSVPKDEAPLVRVDPTTPGRFVLSWEAEGWKPWAWPVGFAALVAVLVGAVVQLVQQARTTRELPRLCAEDGHEVALEAVSVEQDKAGIRVKYRLPEAPAKTGEVVLASAPYVLQTARGERLLALESPRAPGQYLLLEASLSPFLVTPPSPAPAAKAAARTGT
jgi:hypothetical protein